MGLAEFIHGRMDHADLRRIAVGNDQLAALFCQISNDFCGGTNPLLLLREGRSQRSVSKCQYNSFFLHTYPSFLASPSEKKRGISIFILPLVYKTMPAATSILCVSFP